MQVYVGDGACKHVCDGACKYARRLARCRSGRLARPVSVCGMFRTIYYSDLQGNGPDAAWPQERPRNGPGAADCCGNPGATVLS